MQLKGLDLFFWVAGLLGHVALLGVLCYRRLTTRFPFFTALIATNVVRTLVLFLTFEHGSPRIYFLCYWILAILDVGLQLCVVYEMASHVFRPLGVWAHDLRQSALWLIAGSVAVAAMMTWLGSPVTAHWQETALAGVSFFSSAMMSELFVAMVALSVMVGLPWTTQVARISQGLGAYSIVCIVTEAGQSLFGTMHHARIDMTLTHLRMISYLACLGYWVATLSQHAPQRAEMPEEMRRQLSALQERVAYDLQKLRGWRHG